MDDGSETFDANQQRDNFHYQAQKRKLGDVKYSLGDLKKESEGKSGDIEEPAEEGAADAEVDPAAAEECDP